MFPKLAQKVTNGGLAQGVGAGRFGLGLVKFIEEGLDISHTDRGRFGGEASSQLVAVASSQQLVIVEHHNSSVMAR